MPNPWLTIPAADYEGHMDSPAVNQRSFLAATFGNALAAHDCDRVAVLGCATGNGLEHVRREETTRVTAVDINPEFLQILKSRYGDAVPGLEILQDDLESCELEKQAYSLVYAGLVFEYVGPRALLRRVATWLRAGGVLVAVLQLPSEAGGVTETPFVSLRSLSSVMRLIAPEEFRTAAAEAGLTVTGEEIIDLETNKSFYVGTYRAVGPHRAR